MLVQIPYNSSMASQNYRFHAWIVNHSYGLRLRCVFRKLRKFVALFEINAINNLDISISHLCLTKS